MTPPAGKSAALDMFIFRLRELFNNWIPPRRIKDNMTRLERDGKEHIKIDSRTHVYKKEDKGSCIVRMDRNDYEKNVEQTLDNKDMFEVIDVDPSEETELKVKDFINRLAVIGHIEEGTKHFIETKTNETKPGPYYEQPKTHKFNDEEHDMSEGFIQGYYFLQKFTNRSTSRLC